MVAVTADPSRELTLYFRINRDGSIIFSFLDLNGDALSLSPFTFVVNFKLRKSDSSNFLQISPTISGSNATLTVTKAQSAAFREQTYFWEMVRTKGGLEKNWITGDAIFHQGKFDGVTNSGQIFINSFDDMVQITVNETGGSDAGSWIMKGSWDASTNAVPSNGDATILEGFTYENGNHTSTTLVGPDGNVILPYATIRALVDNPGPLLSNPTKWRTTY
jgi:hypothetical protein